MHVTRHTPIDNPVRDGGGIANRRSFLGANDWDWSCDFSGQTAEHKTPWEKKKGKNVQGAKYEPFVVVDLQSGGGGGGVRRNA